MAKKKLHEIIRDLYLEIGRDLKAEQQDEEHGFYHQDPSEIIWPMAY